VHRHLGEGSPPPHKHAVELLGVNLLEDILWGQSAIMTAILAMVPPRPVQRSIMNTREAVCHFAIGSCNTEENTHCFGKVFE
jgi:hypothetical protein